MFRLLGELGTKSDFIAVMKTSIDLQDFGNAPPQMKGCRGNKNYHAAPPVSSPLPPLMNVKFGLKYGLGMRRRAGTNVKCCVVLPCGIVPLAIHMGREDGLPTLLSSFWSSATSFSISRIKTQKQGDYNFVFLLPCLASEPHSCVCEIAYVTDPDGKQSRPRRTPDLCLLRLPCCTGVTGSGLGQPCRLSHTYPPLKDGSSET